jgi:murein DD-endopeptidase MepM/ murein hydrolase activator NlpD
MPRGRHAAPPTHANLTRAAVAGGALLATSGFAVVQAQPAAAPEGLGSDKVATCESSGNGAINPGNGSFGGRQFTQSTWAAFGGLSYAPRAQPATQAQQIAVVERVLAAPGPDARPVCPQGAGTPQHAPSTAPAPASHVAPAPAPSATTVTPPTDTIPVVVAAAPGRHGAPEPAATNHNAQPGDWRSGIGVTVGEDRHRLYADNRAVIGPHPDLIFPGPVRAGRGAAPALAPALALAPASGAHAAPVEHPLPNGVITETFDPPSEMGVDLAAPLGTPIYSATAGTVKYAGPAPGYGDWIVISSVVDGESVDFVYGHEFAPGLLVRPGETVAAGEQIGNVGNNGDSTGPHVEFCVWVGGVGSGQLVDPLAWLASHGVRVG